MLNTAGKISCGNKYFCLPGRPDILWLMLVKDFCTRSHAQSAFGSKVNQTRVIITKGQLHYEAIIIILCILLSRYLCLCRQPQHNTVLEMKLSHSHTWENQEVQKVCREYCVVYENSGFWWHLRFMVVLARIRSIIKAMKRFFADFPATNNKNMCNKSFSFNLI